MNNILLYCLGWIIFLPVFILAMYLAGVYEEGQNVHVLIVGAMGFAHGMAYSILYYWKIKPRWAKDK